MKATAAIGLLLFSAATSVFSASSDALLDGFRSPPPLARPEVWWHWMNSNVSNAGVTADLEAMVRVGIGGAHVFDVTEAIRADGPDEIEIHVTNLWSNRLIGDAQKDDDCSWSGPFLAGWPEFVRKGAESPTGRTTFTTFKHRKKNSKLLTSGLLGPVRIEIRRTKGEM